MNAAAPSDSPTTKQGRRLPPSSACTAPILLAGVSTSHSREGSNARCGLGPGAGEWSQLLPAGKGALVGRSCLALCRGETGPVTCQARHFFACMMETPLCSLSCAEGTFDFKSCCNTCLNSGHCSLTLWSQHSPPCFPVDCLP